MCQSFQPFSGNSKSRQSLGIVNMPFSDVLEHFFQRYGYHIKEFTFIQMLMGMHQILRQIQVNQFIAESRCSIYIS